VQAVVKYDERTAMCWICDHPGATQQDYFEELRTRVLNHGWAVQYVEIDRAPYAYTVGLHDEGLPELLVSGLSPSWAGRLLNSVAQEAVEGHALHPGERIVHGGVPILEIVEVEHPDAHMDWAIAFGGPGVDSCWPNSEWK
jgi:hypothetical protein